MADREEVGTRLVDGPRPHVWQQRAPRPGTLRDFLGEQVPGGLEWFLAGDECALCGLGRRGCNASGLLECSGTTSSTRSGLRTGYAAQPCAVYDCPRHGEFPCDPRLPLVALVADAEDCGWALKALDAPPTDPIDRRHVYLCPEHRSLTVEQVLLGWRA